MRKNRVLLVVNNDPLLLKQAAPLLSRMAYTVIQCVEGGHLPQLVLHLQPYALMVDLDSSPNGVSLLRQLRSSAHSSALPVIVCSSHPERCDAGQLEGLADGVLAKPLDQRRLLELLDTAGDRHVPARTRAQRAYQL